jgi:2-polyprenyl-6-hydroxyphenyl methylase/3-demethylubiquinone-9 3-methyltransferase
MGLGPFIRRMFGPYERQVSDAYRAIFFNIGDFQAHVHAWKPTAQRILEVGCGEGAVTERLNAAYPDAEITAIDITPRIGRLYRGQRRGVRFMQCSVQDVAAAEPGRYDLVVLCDVLHHVPAEYRQDLLDAIRAAMAPGGTFVIKEWERTNTPGYWLGYASDRWITGDRIGYMTGREIHDLLAHSFGAAAPAAVARCAPWRNNIAMLVTP